MSDARIEQLEAALRIGREMRAKQKEYFKTRDRGVLIASKQLEASFDKAVGNLIGATG